MSTFHLLGVGPGDPGLITLKAAEILGRCPVWFAPRATDSSPSTALEIALAAVASRGKEIINHTFPMKKIHRGEIPDPEVARAWEKAATLVTKRLAAGLEVAFPTLGDPTLYSTGFYVCEALLAKAPETNIEIIPGVSSITAAAAAAGVSLCQGNQRFTVIPATYENGALARAIETSDTVVLMKVHRVMARVKTLLTDLGLLDRAVLVERVGQNNERVVRGLSGFDPARGCHYFSTVIISRGNGR